MKLGEIPPDVWDAKRVAEYLGVAESSVLKGRAGTKALPRLRRRPAAWDPRDVIEFREQLRAKDQDYRRRKVLRQVG